MSASSSPSSSPDCTEHQLLASKSNYELLQSGITLPTNRAHFAAFQASAAHKRAYHQRREKTRRDRMKCALETLAAVLPPDVSTTMANGASKGTNQVETVERAAEYIKSLHRKLDTTCNPTLKQ